MIKRLYAQWLIGRSSVLFALAFGLLCGMILGNYESFTGDKATVDVVYTVVERYLALTVLFVAVQMWSDIEGRRPRLLLSLPFNRAEMVFNRLLLPMAVYAFIAATILLYADINIADMDIWEMGVNSLPPAFLLLAAATLVGLLARNGMAGASVAMAWWLMEITSGGRYTKQFYLFAASDTKPEVNLVANRWELAVIAVIMAVAAWRLYRRNERFMEE
ncbi:hypothetical protein [Mahella sp.]|uniref:hypothetical protein n=1 Tax=Mahella sp. TaxID=2798721 RepID=UPI0025BAA509|nr:hypothetical protein [Mahella sp.]MBZ4664841.1 hypothetical protein [Mahella sp.]